MITLLGRPAARLSPIIPGLVDARAVVEGFKAYIRPRRRTLGRRSSRSVIEDGRRY